MHEHKTQGQNLNDPATDSTTLPLLDPTYNLLDHPVALGGADDEVLTAPVPETPMIDGRPVEDPRLIEALSVAQNFTRADVLDRAAKLGGVLRVLGADGASQLIITRDVPKHVRAFALFAGVRIGVLVVDEAANAPEAAVPDSETLTIRTGRDGEDTPETGQSAIRTAVRSVRSHFEGVVVEGGGRSRDLDRLVRDSRIEPAPSRLRDANRPALVVNGDVIVLGDVTPHLSSLLTTD